MSKISNDERPAWDDYFMLIVDAVSQRATCNRGKSGAVIVKNNRILATGYVGAPSQAKDCYQVGHLFEERISSTGEVKQHCIRTIHAEQNAIASAARAGVAVENSTLYCTMEPCFNCAKLIVAVGITKVVAKFQYQASSESRTLFNESNVLLEVLNSKVLGYNN